MRLPVCMVSLLLLLVGCQAKNEVATIRKAAEQGDAIAQAHLGALYYSGQGVPPDYMQAAIWYRKAAEQGYVKAQFNLGQMYEYGQGVTQDYAQAAIWYRKAANQGYEKAQCKMGAAYYHGLGVPQNDAKAAIWYRRAALQGVARAQYNLGAMYYLGHGVPQNYAKAYFWLDLAAAGRVTGVNPGKIARDRNEAALHLDPPDLTKAQERALQWAEEHPNRFHGQSAALGLCAQGPADMSKRPATQF